jgi:hypothetical protein
MIAIIFTVITPLLFYMNTVNNLYDNISTEMRDLDQQRTWEELEVLAWAEGEGERYIFVRNKGSLAVNIIRVWVVPETPQLFVRNLNELIVTPGETIEINDPEVNAFINELEDTRYFIKIATQRGNIFASSFAAQVFEPGYGHPLVIMSSSWIEKEEHGQGFIVHLEIMNQMGYDFYVDYVVLTGISGIGGGPSQVRLKPETGVFGWYFASGTPENPVIHIHIIPDVSFTPVIPVSIKVELINPDNFVIGAFYFIGPW